MQPGCMAGLSAPRKQLLAAGCLFVALVGCRVMPTAAPAATPAPTETAAPTATPEPTAVPAPSATPMAARWTPGQLEIHLMDVQHGDAQLIVSPTGESLLIDCGRVEYAGKVAQYVRDVLGEAAVDYMVVSHYHLDHIGSFVPLFRDEGLKVRRAILDRGGGRDAFTDEDEYGAYYDYVTDPAHGLKRARVRAGGRLDLGPRLSVQVLTVGDVDSKTAMGVPVIGENDNSVALWLTFGKLDYWSGGDLSGVDSYRYANMEKAVIPLLPREADVAKSDHHGIEYNNNIEFLTALRPQVELVSGNSGVIKLATLKRMAQFGDVYITGDVAGYKVSGDIVLTSKDGETFTVEGKTYTSK